MTIGIALIGCGQIATAHLKAVTALATTDLAPTLAEDRQVCRDHQDL